MLAAWLAHLAFWSLLVYGVALGELDAKRLAVFLILWVIGLLAVSYAPFEPARAMFPSFVALLDIALVFVIFKGDVRLT